MKTKILLIILIAFLLSGCNRNSKPVLLDKEESSQVDIVFEENSELDYINEIFKNEKEFNAWLNENMIPVLVEIVYVSETEPDYESLKELHNAKTSVVIRHDTGEMFSGFYYYKYRLESGTKLTMGERRVTDNSVEITLSDENDTKYYVVSMEFDTESEYSYIGVVTEEVWNIAVLYEKYY